MRRGNIALLAGVLLVCGAQANILIDDFNNGFASQSSTSGIYYNTASGTAIGGFRYIDHQFSSNPLLRPILTDVNNVAPGHLFIEAGSGIDGAATVAWGGSTTSSSGSGLLTPTDFSGLGSLDLTTEAGIEVDYINNDQASTYIVAVVFDSLGNFSNTNLQNANVGNGTMYFDFASFFGSADMTDIEIIALSVALPNGNDITLTRVEAVPEPATMAVLGLGLATLARRKRK